MHQCTTKTMESEAMARVTILLNDSEQYISVEAEEFHEDECFLKAYSQRHELVAMVDIKFVKAAYQTEERLK